MQFHGSYIKETGDYYVIRDVSKFYIDALDEEITEHLVLLGFVLAEIKFGPLT